MVEALACKGQIDSIRNGRGMAKDLSGIVSVSWGRMVIVVMLTFKSNSVGSS